MSLAAAAGRPPSPAADDDDAPPPLVAVSDVLTPDDILQALQRQMRPAAAASASADHAPPPPAIAPRPSGRGRPLGWRKSNSAEQNAALIAAAVAARRSGTAQPTTHAAPRKQSTQSHARKAAATEGAATSSADGAAEASAAPPSAAAAELAALVSGVQQAWAKLEFNMMHRPIPEADTAGADDAATHAATPAAAPAASASAAAAPEAHLNPMARRGRSVFMDAEERKELLEHVELLRERKARDGGAKASGLGKSSRVGPRYQCKMPSTMPPPLTDEIRAAVAAEPYDYERFARDECPVHEADYDLQVQLEKGSTGFPAYPLDERHRVRITEFIAKRRERKRKEDERRAQQSVQQQIQEHRAGFSFHALDQQSTARGKAAASAANGVVAAAHSGNGRRSRSPPAFNPLDSYGSITLKAVSELDGDDSLESKRRSSRITPSLVVKQFAKGTTGAAPDLGSGLPSALEQYGQSAADKRTVREQAEADRKLAQKLQAYYEREQPEKGTGKRKVRKEPAAPTKDPVAKAPSSTAKAPSAAAAASAVSVAVPPVVKPKHSASAHSLHIPPSSLASLPSPPKLVPLHAVHARVAAAPAKRARSPVDSDGSDAEEAKHRSTSKPRSSKPKPDKPKLIRAPSANEIAAVQAAASVSSISSIAMPTSAHKRKDGTAAIAAAASPAHSNRRGESSKSRFGAVPILLPIDYSSLAVGLSAPPVRKPHSNDLFVAPADEFDAAAMEEDEEEAVAAAEPVAKPRKKRGAQADALAGSGKKAKLDHGKTPERLLAKDGRASKKVK